MIFELFSKVALKVDVPFHKLRKGDVASIVEAHPGREKNRGIRWRCSTRLGRPWRS